MSLIKYFSLEFEIKKQIEKENQMKIAVLIDPFYKNEIKNQMEKKNQMKIAVFIDPFYENENEIIKQYIEKGYERDDLIIHHIKKFWLDDERYRNGLGFRTSTGYYSGNGKWYSHSFVDDKSYKYEQIIDLTELLT